MRKIKIILLMILIILIPACKKEEKNFKKYNEFVNLPNNWLKKEHGVYGEFYTDYKDIIIINKFDQIENFEEVLKRDINFWKTGDFRLNDKWNIQIDSLDDTKFEINTNREQYAKIKGIILKKNDKFEYIAISAIEKDKTEELYYEVFKDK